MKRKSFLFSFLFVAVCVFTGKTQVDPDWHCWQVQVSGVDSLQRADYLSRGLEKIQLSLFSAFEVTSGKGYIISSMPNIDNIISYVNNWDRGFNIQSFEEVTLTDSLFLAIYLQRRNIATEDMYNQELPYVRLGPFVDLAKQLYEIALNEWRSQYSTRDQH